LTPSFEDLLLWEEPCTTCQVRKRCGPLPCHYRIDVDLLNMNADKPTVFLLECPHYIPENNPADLLEWIR